MVSQWEIYLLLKLDTFTRVAGASCVVSAILMVLIALTYAVSKSDVYSSEKDEWVAKNYPSFKKFFTVMLAIFVLSLPTYVLIPTTKEACGIIGISSVVNNTKVQELATTGTDIVLEYSKVILEELQDGK